MNPENLEPINIDDVAKKYEPFKTNEIELLQMLSLQAENIIAPTLQKYNLFYYVQATNEIFAEIVKNTGAWCEMKRKNDEVL